MTDQLRQAAQQALEALEGLFGLPNQWESGGVAVWRLGGSDAPRQAITALKAALEQQAEPPPEWPLIKNILAVFGLDAIAFVAEFKAAQKAEPVSQAVIAGALFDFMGWLTTRKERLILSSTDDASPAADAIKVFAEMRGLSLNDARVQDWQNYTTQQQAEPVAWTTMPEAEDWCFVSGSKDPTGKLEGKWFPLYTTPPQRQWQGLTDEDCKRMSAGDKLVAMWAERILKERNT